MNMKRIKSLLLGVLAVALIAGCSTRVARNVNSDINGAFVMPQVEKAIIDSGRAQHWEMKKMRDGLIIGKLVTDDSLAEIRIPYTLANYSIEYVGSQNLNSGTDKVPSGYNDWVSDLNKEIQNRLLAQQQLYNK
ncbi:hypothetical protein LPW36_06625 [Jinshanibacter sp. LJY008]|uniref:Lipoprotein n=1 Tax=Limnobaculum eriocheiris TaxID=2897391 RepID=A0A9X1MU87_9GAMM|nr:hypothetical protein [Limnobaculum eriocheiris]MCD1125681.1 hypothetical protein [Limnobaculum eriocheiris]